jgi:hypothetical protein
LLQRNTPGLSHPDAAERQFHTMERNRFMAAPQLSADHPPQMLHWLARKAAVPLDRTKAAWRLALREGIRGGDAPGSSPYWERVLASLQTSLAAETVALEAAPFGYGPLLRLPARLWLLGLNGSAKIAVAATRGWGSDAWWQRPAH